MPRQTDMLRSSIALRVLAAQPAFTFVAALWLALGIGANSAIFSLVDALWFRPLAVADSSRILRVYGVTGQDREALLSYAEYLDVARQATTLVDLVAIGGRGAMLVDGDTRQLLTLNLVSSNFFTALGITPALGRVFTPQDQAISPDALIVVRNRQRKYVKGENCISSELLGWSVLGSAVRLEVCGMVPPMRCSKRLLFPCRLAFTNAFGVRLISLIG